MIPAAELKTGMILRIEKHLYKILATEYHTGAGKMGGLAHAKLREVRSGLLLDKKFKPEEKLDVVELDRKNMEFLYAAGDEYTVMDPETYEQIQLDRHLLKPFGLFLTPNMKFPVEFLDDVPVNVVFPSWVELQVRSTPPSLSSQQDEVPKPATLSNGMEIQVPQFIKVGDVVRVDVTTRKYIERSKR